jgi:eukaryotic-like serine/threonine-protein kinase
VLLAGRVTPPSGWMAAPGDLVGPYRVDRPIGRGGMGQVFAAIHHRMGQEVALKLLVPSGTGGSQTTARFIQEARALAQMDHPGVVRIFQCERLEDGRVYLAMELLSGVQLRDWIESHSGPAPLGAVLSIGEQIAAAMAEVHRKGIVHRDLKPENVFLCADPRATADHRVKILDFGIAKVPPVQQGPIVDTQVLTNVPMFMGTATYVAPEQCRRPAEVTDRADVYALGVMFFELCAGRPPFVADDRVDLIAMHVREPPPSLLDLARHVPEQLSAFIASMLAKNPGERPTMARCREMFGLPWEAVRGGPAMPGLSPFSEAQAELFHGRSAELDELMQSPVLRGDSERKWLQIEGPSGVGKSSLVHAGLVPRLKRRSMDGSADLRIACLQPSSSPVRSLAEALFAALENDLPGESADTVEEALRARADALLTLARTRAPSGGCLLLFIDQMEQMFTVGAADCARFDELVATAMTGPGSPVRLLTTIRSDFLHRFDQAPRLAALLQEAERYPLRTMRDNALAEVIHGIVRRLGLRLADGLVERMVRDARSAASPLPFVGHALSVLWSLRSGPVVTSARYDELGGVSGALSLQAEQLLASLGEEGRGRARRILLDLVQIGRGVPDTRRPRTRREVLEAAGEDALAEEVLLRLSGGRTSAAPEDTASMRLVVLSGDPEPARQRVELIHETLLQAVPTIAGWIERDRDRLERQADLEALARAWEEAGCPSEGLPSGTLLAHYTAAGSSPRRASERARRFLGNAAGLERRSRRIRRVAVVSLLAAAIATTVSAVVARREQQRAEANLLGIVAATDEIVDDVDWQLGRILHTSHVRRPLLLQSEERVTSAADQGNVEVRMAVIRARHRRSDFARVHGTLAEADDLLAGASREIREGLAAYPTDASWTLLLALNDSKRGKIAMARGRWEEASGFFTRSIEQLKRLSGLEEEDLRRTTATSHAEMAELHAAQGRADVAVTFFDRAVDLLSRNPSGYDRGEMALALTGRAEAARKGGDRRRAGADLARALELQTALVRGTPGNAYFQWTLARIHVELAALRVEEGATDDAATHCREALAIGRTLHDGEPTDKTYALVLAFGLEQAESIARAGSETGQAERARDERCALVAGFIARDPEDLRFERLRCR